MDRVVAGEAFTEVVVEVARADEGQQWVHRIRSLVLTDPEGRPDCLVLVLEDETELYNAENRFERAFNGRFNPRISAALRRQLLLC
jgi:hypothetical protein